MEIYPPDDGLMVTDRNNPRHGGIGGLSWETTNKKRKERLL